MKLSALVPPPGKSKYELSIVAAREARRLNDWVRRSGETMPGKVTAVALGRVISDEVPYYYEDPMAILAQNAAMAESMQMGDLGMPLMPPPSPESVPDPLPEPTDE